MTYPCVRDLPLAPSKGGNYAAPAWLLLTDVSRTCEVSLAFLEGNRIVAEAQPEIAKHVIPPREGVRGRKYV
ncbi:MAG: hypothetical protein AAFY70_08285 [Bacteroidota bacterium]